MGSRDHLFKVLVVGDAAVGKTSLVQRYSQDSFSRHYKSTVGGETSLRARWARGRHRGLGPWAPLGRGSGGFGVRGPFLGSGSRCLGSWREQFLGV